MKTFFDKYSGLTALALVLVASFVPSAANIIFALLIIFLGVTVGYLWFQKKTLYAAMYALAMVILLVYLSKK